MKFKLLHFRQKQMPETNEKPMEDYYAKERPRPSDMEKAEGDEDIVDEAVKNLEKSEDPKKVA